jgi:hypothetical protein
MAAQSVEHFLFAVLLNRDVDRNEVLLDNRLDFRGLDEPIELLTPPSPGRVKDGEDGTVTLGCLAFGLIEDGRCGGRLLRARERCAEQDGDRDHDRASKWATFLHLSSPLQGEKSSTTPIITCRLKMGVPQEQPFPIGEHLA